MRAFTSLLQLPLSLLVTSFALRVVTAAAAPVSEAEPEVQLKYLTPDNFKSSIAKGVWFVEHFSPYCHHCRTFAPTWSILVGESKEKPDPGITLAQVNCVVYGDLCEENEIKYFPQLNLYKDGALLETFSGVRDLEVLQDYISKHAEPTGTGVVVESATPTALAEVLATAVAEEVLHIQTPRAEPNPGGAVLSLNPSIFAPTLEQGPTFIKYYAPWCGHCKKLAPTWTQLARHMQGKLTIAEVNCEDYGALCKSEDVAGYPMLVYYANGARSEYMGGRKFEALKAFTEKAAAPAVQEVRVENLESSIKEHDVVYLLLHAASDSRTLNEITAAAGVLIGSVPVLTSNSPELFSRYAIATPWALLALKDHDTTTPAAVYHSSIQGDKDSLTEWFLANRLPVSTELSQETFQTIMNAQHKPLVVIVPVDKGTKDRVSEKVREIAKKWRVKKGGKGGRDIVFTWMDAGKWGSWLKSMYGLKTSGDTDEPAVIIADHGNLIYYDKDQSDSTIRLSSPSIFGAIDGIDKGTILPKHSENFAERMSRYLNAKLISLEKFVTTKPLQAIAFVVIALVLVFFALKRALRDDFSDPRDQKSRRLD